jgi:hypothetical protein
MSGQGIQDPAALVASICKFKAEEDKPAPAYLAALNLLLLLLIGTAIAWWMIEFTDWFTPFITFISLGGILSWVGSLLNIIPESRLKGFKETVYNGVINHVWFTVFIVAGFAAAGYFAAHLGSIEMHLAGDSSDRSIQIFQNGRLTRGPEWIEKGARQRFVFYIPRHGETVLVKLSGYPATRPVITPSHCEKLRTPDAFFSRPLLLLRPSPDLISQFEKQTEATIRYNGKRYKTAWGRYSVWIGCDADVSVPAELEKKWTDEAKDPRIVRLYWVRPGATTRDIELSNESPAGDVEIEWTTNRKVSGVFATTQRTISIQPSSDVPAQTLSR